jgi:hypothetical protein
VCRTVSGNTFLSFDPGSPADAERFGLTEVLLPRLRLQTDGIHLLPCMLWALPCIHQAQAMQARGYPYGGDPHTWINILGIERYETYGPWEHQKRI